MVKQDTTQVDGVDYFGVTEKSGIISVTGVSAAFAKFMTKKAAQAA